MPGLQRYADRPEEKAHRTHVPFTDMVPGDHGTLRGAFAVRAYPHEFEPVAKNIESRYLGSGPLDSLYRLGHDIMDLSATQATHVIMVLRFAVEPCPPPRLVELHDLAVRRQEFEVAIDGAQADPGKPFPHNLIKLVGGRVRIKLRKLLEDYLALSGIS
jgi:hypothetical protein